MGSRPGTLVPVIPAAPAGAKQRGAASLPARREPWEGRGGCACGAWEGPMCWGRVPLAPGGAAHRKKPRGTCEQPRIGGSLALSSVTLGHPASLSLGIACGAFLNFFWKII